MKKYCMKEHKMSDKCCCCYNWWDNTIIDGITKHDNKYYYFTCYFPGQLENGMYHLTLLNNNIYKLSMEYSKLWRKQIEYKTIIRELEKQHLKYFNKMYLNCKKIVFERIDKRCETIKKIKEEYLENKTPTYIAKGNFSGSIDFINGINVEWENVIEI